MKQTFLLLDLGLIDKPAGKTLDERIAAYKKLSAPALGTLIAGIQSLMMNELTSDMQDDLMEQEAETEEASEDLDME